MSLLRTTGQQVNVRLLTSLLSPSVALDRVSVIDLDEKNRIVSTRDVTTSAWCEHKGRLKSPLPRAVQRKRSKQEHDDAPVPPTKPELVERYLQSLITSKEKRHAVSLPDVIKEFQRFPGDTGSSEVQAALLTSRIAALAEHLKVHKKDYSSKRGLMAMLNSRRQLLQYLRQTSFDRYATVLGKLGLKDALGKKYDRLSSRYHD